MIVKKSKVGEIKSEDGLEKFDASSPTAIPPPISPPPKLDPEDRRRKIAALKVQYVCLLCYICAFVQKIMQTDFIISVHLHTY